MTTSWKHISVFCLGAISLVLPVSIHGFVFANAASPFDCQANETPVVLQSIFGPTAGVTLCADLKNTNEIITVEKDKECPSQFQPAHPEQDPSNNQYCVKASTLWNKRRERFAQASKDAKTPDQQAQIQKAQKQEGEKIQEQQAVAAKTWTDTRDELVKEADRCSVGNVFCIIKKLFSVATNVFLMVFLWGPLLVYSFSMLVVALASAALATALNNILFRGIIQATLNIPVIPGKGIEILDLGWTFSRDLVNLFFLVLLVFIGLATILRLPSYQMKKTLPLLLIMAVLVNFSGLLVGFVVDISNIFTNFFLSKAGTWGDFPAILGSMVTSVGQQMMNLIRLDTPPAGYMMVLITPAVTMTVVGAFFAMMTLVFLYAFVLFIVRIAALWVISILAPFAFFAYILPGTRSWSNKWLHELISWSFFGIPLAFFLYLSTFIMRNLGTITHSLYPDGSLVTKEFWSELLTQTPDELLQRAIIGVIAPTIAIIFLFIGIRISKQMAPEGAKSVINYTKKAAMGAMGFAGMQTFGRLMQGKGGAFMQNIAKSDFGPAKFLNKLKEDNAADSNPLRRGVRSAVIGFGGSAIWAVRKGASLALQYKSIQAKGLDSSMGELEKQYGKDPDSIAASYASTGNLDYQKKMAIILQLAKIKGGKGISKLSTDQQREAIRLIAAYQGGKMADVIKHNPALIEDEQVGTLIQKTLVSDGAEKDDSGKYKDKDMQALAESAERRGLPIDGQALIKEAAYKKAVDEMGAADLDNADKALMENEKFKEMVARWKPWNFIRKIGQEWGGDMLDKLQEQAEKMTTKDSPEGDSSEKWTALHEVAKTNPSFFKAIDTPEGRMFMRAWEGKEMEGNGKKLIIEEKQDIKTFMQKVKTTLPSKPEVPKDTELEKALKEPKGLPDIQVLKMSGTLKDMIRQGNAKLQAIKADIQLLKQMIQNQRVLQTHKEELEKLLADPTMSPKDKSVADTTLTNIENKLKSFPKDIEEKRKAIKQDKENFETTYRERIVDLMRPSEEQKKLQDTVKKINTALKKTK